MIYFRAVEYLRYLVKSAHRRGHGIHSPFVFKVVSQIFRNKTDPAVVFCVEKVRKRMISDSRVIMTNDLGAGHCYGNKESRMRKVSEIARYSSVTRKYCNLLSNMAKEFGGPHIIELGTSLGISSMYMALSSPDITIHTIEGCPETAEIAAANFDQAMIQNIKLHQGAFDDRLPEILASASAPGLVFIDGNHRKEPLLKYFNLIVERSDTNTVIIVDDIYLSHEMEEAWQSIKSHEKVSVTIDLYRMGLVFFRKGINCNHFVVRY